MKSKLGQPRLCEDAALSDNRLDLARLLLATAVIFSHSFPLSYGDNSQEPLDFLSQHQKTLGGLAVDCFFAISGFLIVKSWLSSSSMAGYFRKRVLRIHPGYIVASIFSLVVAVFSCSEPLKYLSELRWRQFVFTFFSLGYGVLDAPGLAFPGNPHGGVNASLWTIQIEFYAYMAVACYGLFGLFKYRRLWICFSSCVMFVYLAKVVRGGDADAYWRFGSMFASGATFYLFRDLIPRSPAWLVIAVTTLVAGCIWWPVFNIALPFAIPYILFYFTLVPAPKWAERLRGTDLSYGIYLYAFPIQQSLVHWFNLDGPWTLFAFATPLTYVLAYLSWHGVEKRALGLKSRKFEDHDPVDSRGDSTLRPQ
jgi:peptidoglycan/LPS O-acetylase OafA/YrhL